MCVEARFVIFLSVEPFPPLLPALHRRPVAQAHQRWPVCPRHSSLACARLKPHTSHGSMAKHLKRRLTDIAARHVYVRVCAAGGSGRRSAVCSGVRAPSFSLKLKREHAQRSSGCPSPSQARLSSWGKKKKSNTPPPNSQFSKQKLHLQQRFRSQHSVDGSLGTDVMDGRHTHLYEQDCGDILNL